MDVDHARTLLAIVETGSFKEAANKLHLTQSAISARIKALEYLLGKKLFDRQKSGVRLTSAGEHFYRHATTLVRVWRQALLEVGVSDRHADHLAVGAQLSLWEGFLLRWIAAVRATNADLAISAHVGNSRELVDRIAESTLDIAVAYRAAQRPGLIVEHLCDDELVLVSSSSENSMSVADPRYVFVNWGAEFVADHAETYPGTEQVGLRLDLGAIALNYLLENEACGYFPLRIIEPYVRAERLWPVTKARRFVYPVYAVYPENYDSTTFGPVIESLRIFSQASEAED